MESDHRFSPFSRWDLLTLTGFGLLGGSFAWALPRLPDPLPIHFTAAGQVDGWADKAYLPLIVFGIPGIAWLLLLLTGWMLSASQKNPVKASVAAAHPLRGCLGLGTTLLATGGLLTPLYGIACLHAGAALIAMCLILGLIFMVRETKDLLVGLSDAKNYRWGVFYVNAQDPKLWVEKRLGVGWTLNYAHPAAWWMTLLLLLPVLVGLGVLLFLKH
jgi:uncharacterized membrane protein